jgi:UDP-N-acetylglucosamine/UDP-N-acetylgalactosamine diphosphorylase
MTDARLEKVRQLLTSHHQEHLLRFYDELTEPQQKSLLDQIEGQDWAALDDLIETHVKKQPELHLPTSIEPAPAYPATPPTRELSRMYAKARAHGEKLIGEGRVAAFTVAGGQGTRLGWDAPKGTFPATPITNKPLFQVFAESIIKTSRKYQTAVPWYIMTSPLNDAPTRKFFAEHKFFGLDPQSVMFFPQGTIPSFSLDGKALLAGKGELATNPDGHGGSLRALWTSGAINDMERRGVQQISYFQVDNPIVRCVDPLFIGLHAQNKAQMSSKMVTKAHAAEKVGNFVLADGKVSVIEYSDLPKELEQQKDEDGTPTFNAGSIAIHVIDVNFVKQLNAGRFGLPYHRAVKKVPHIDVATGKLVEPATPNAVKLETFVFDALPLCESSIILETLREEEFAPIKNAEGADSPATSRQLQSDRAGRWLEAAGVRVPHDNGHIGATIELSPLTAVEPEDLRAGVQLPEAVDAGTQLVL